MRIIKGLIALPVLLVAAACGNDPAPAPGPDLSFLRDLDLAVVQAPVQPVISEAELGFQAEAAAESAAAAAPRPAASGATQTSARRASSGTGTTAARAPVARTVTVKNTKRDAAIGAGAGAVIGAVAGGPNHRVKGAVAGAVVGGVIGGVIGNNVDKSTKVVYEHSAL
jgi:hypothetical protein